MIWLWIAVRACIVLALTIGMGFTCSIVMAVRERVRSGSPATPELQKLRPHVLLLALTAVGTSGVVIVDLLGSWAHPPSFLLPFVLVFSLTALVGQRALYHYEAERIRKGE